MTTLTTARVTEYEHTTRAMQGLIRDERVGLGVQEPEYRNLAAAVILRAHKDLRSAQPKVRADAEEFLRGETPAARLWFGVLGGSR